MSTARTDAEAEKDHLLEDEEGENSSEMSGGRTAVGSPTNRLASIDIEGLNDVDVEKNNANKPDTPQKNVAKLVTWIVVNTLATIGIVRFLPSQTLTQCSWHHTVLLHCAFADSVHVL